MNIVVASEAPQQVPVFIKFGGDLIRLSTVDCVLRRPSLFTYPPPRGEGDYAVIVKHGNNQSSEAFKTQDDAEAAVISLFNVLSA
jgi:hypothetical protein